MIPLTPISSIGNFIAGRSHDEVLDERVFCDSQKSESIIPDWSDQFGPTQHRGLCDSEKSREEQVQQILVR